jgi:shikimate dehydrogenase
VTAAKEGRTRGQVGPLAALEGADGVRNCAPLGMDGFLGSPVPAGAFPQAAWAFDAVYSPVDAPFRAQTQAARARFLPG